jgi:hypothetical protein
MAKPNNDIPPIILHRWIPIRERLPGIDGMYLVYAKTEDSRKPLIRTAWFNPKSGWSLLPAIWIDSISHWTYPPEPPTE